MADSSLTVSSLMLYPIKSCGGIPLSSAQVTGTGLATLNGILRDRTWVVVRDQGPKFLTQRQLPKMALIQVAVEPAALLHDAAAVDLADAALVLQAPGMPPLRVPLAPPPPSAADIIDVEVWAWTGKGVDTGAAAAEWFSAYLGRAARLVRYGGTPNLPEPASADPLRREVIWPWAPPGHEVAFADGFPVLAATDASLADLNSRLDSPVPMNRFRPNIILAGGTPWEEDTWDRVAVGEAGLELLNVKPCSRCKIPTIDQATAEVGAEPQRTMNSFRSGEALGWTEPKEFKFTVFFGVNMVVAAGAGSTLSVGEGAKVLTRTDGLPNKAGAA